MTTAGHRGKLLPPWLLALSSRQTPPEVSADAHKGVFQQNRPIVDVRASARNESGLSRISEARRRRGFVGRTRGIGSQLPRWMCTQLFSPFRCRLLSHAAGQAEWSPRLFTP